jgi:hypothetical protein
MCAIERSLEWAPASLSLSKSVPAALAKDQDPGLAIERPREQHTRHVDLLIEPRDVLGERALQQAVVLRDEGELPLVFSAQPRSVRQCGVAERVSRSGHVSRRRSLSLWLP